MAEGNTFTNFRSDHETQSVVQQLNPGKNNGAGCQETSPTADTGQIAQSQMFGNPQHGQTAGPHLLGNMDGKDSYNDRDRPQVHTQNVRHDGNPINTSFGTTQENVDSSFLGTQSFGDHGKTNVDKWPLDTEMKEMSLSQRGGEQKADKWTLEMKGTQSRKGSSSQSGDTDVEMMDTQASGRHTVGVPESNKDVEMTDEEERNRTKTEENERKRMNATVNSEEEERKRGEAACALQTDVEEERKQMEASSNSGDRQQTKWNEFFVAINHSSNVVDQVDATSVLTPPKMQYLLNFKIEYLQKVIQSEFKALGDFNIESAEKRLLIKVSQSPQPGLANKIISLLVDSMDKISMKSLPAVCLQTATIQLKKHLQERSLTLFVDKEQIYLVGMAKVIAGLDDILSKIKHQRNFIHGCVSFHESVDLLVLQSLGLKDQFVKLFPDVTVDLNVEMHAATLSGIEEMTVRCAEEEIKKFVESIKCVPLSQPTYMLQLLQLSEIDILLKEKLKSQKLNVVFKVSTTDEKINVYCINSNDIEDFKATLEDELISVKFPVVSKGSDALTFASSKEFVDFIELHQNKRLICTKQKRNVCIFTKRELASKLLEMDTVFRKDQEKVIKKENKSSENIINTSHIEEADGLSQLPLNDIQFNIMERLNFIGHLHKKYANCIAELKNCALYFSGSKSQMENEVKTFLGFIFAEELKRKGEIPIPDECFEFVSRDNVKAHINKKLEAEQISCYWFFCKTDRCLKIFTFENIMSKAKDVILNCVDWDVFAKTTEIESVLNDKKMKSFLHDQNSDIIIDDQEDGLCVVGLSRSMTGFRNIYKELVEEQRYISHKVDISWNVVKYFKERTKTLENVSVVPDEHGDVCFTGYVENVNEAKRQLEKMKYVEEKWTCQVDIPGEIKEQICAQKVGQLEDHFGCLVFVEADTSCVNHQQIVQWVNRKGDRHVVLVYGSAADIPADVIACPAGYTDTRNAIFEAGGALLKNGFEQLEKQTAEIHLSAHTGNLPCLMVAYLNVPENLQGQAMRTYMIKIITELLLTVEKHQLQSIVIPIKMAQNCPGSTFLLWFCDAFKVFQYNQKYVNQILLCSEDPNIPELVDILKAGFQNDLFCYDFLNMFEVTSKHSKARKKTADITVTLVEGGLVDQKVDVIVNSCNRELELNKGAVSCSILEVAGESILKECKKKFPNGVAYGKVVTTKPGNMKCKIICHGALPKWIPTAQFSTQILAKVVFDSLLAAESTQGQSIAFPVFGTGNLAYPWHEVAKTMLSTVYRYGRKHPDTLLKEVKIVLFNKDEKSIEAFQDEKTKIEKAIFIQEDHLPPPSKILECRCNSIRVKIEPLIEPEFHQCEAVVFMYSYAEAVKIDKDDPKAELIKNGIAFEKSEEQNFYVVSIVVFDNKKIADAIEKILKFSQENRLATLAIYFMHTKGSLPFIEQADTIINTVYKWENRYLQVLKLLISDITQFHKLVKEMVSKQKEHGSAFTSKIMDYFNFGRLPWKCVSHTDVNQSPKLKISLVGPDQQSVTDLKDNLQKEVASLKSKVGMSLGATIRNAKSQTSLAYSTWIRTSKMHKVNLPVDICKQLDEALEFNIPIAEIQEGNTVFLYDFGSKQYKIQGQNDVLGIFFKQGSCQDPTVKVPSNTKKQKNEVTDVYDILYGTINPGLRSKADYIKSKCKKLNISFNKEVVSGTFEQLTELNRKLIDKFGVETGVFDLDKKANNLPSNVKEQQTQNDYEHIVRISLSYMEYKMMKFFYPNDPIFKANSQYEKGILCTLLDVGENGQTIEDDAKKKLAHLNSYAEFEVVATEGKTIDDDKLGEVYRGIKDISDQIFIFRSNDKKVLKLRGSNYEKLQNAKTKIEFLLGAKQQGKGGRRDRVITTEANYNSKKDEKMDTSTSSYSRSFSTGSSGSSSSKPPPDMSFKTSEGIIIKVYVANILQLNVECIVNAANEHLSHGAGVAEVISRAAGYSFQQECDDYIKKYGDVKVTKCCTTSGGNLKYKYVIHVVGPKWYDYPTDKRMCAKDLKKTIENSFYEAETINVSTIALPAVSSGIFGVPRDVCCSQYCQAVIEYSNKSGIKTCLKEIHFIDKDAEIIKMIQKEFATQLNMISNPSSGSDPSVPSSHASGSRINDEKGLLQRSLSSDASTNPDKNSSGQKRDFSSTVQKSSSSKFIKQYITDKGLKVNIVEEDITKMNVDVIVCPQDDLCQGKGGIAKAIENISDSVYRTKVFAMKKINKCEVRRYPASPNLPFKHVLHTVPPKWDNHASKDNKKFMQDLDLTIRNIIRHCSDSQDIKTVAIPILGVGYGLPTPYATCAGSLSDVISTEAQRDKFKIEEVYIVTHEKGMAIAVADTFDKESIFKSLTTFQRHNKKQQNRQDGKLSASGTGDEMKGRNNKSDETTYSNKSDNGKLGSTVRGENLEDCAICLSTPSDPRKLKCGHIFCEGCISQQFKFKPVCPNCGSIQGVITGDQPPGKISVCTMPKLHLPGYPECGRIDIFYEIYPGKQGPEHPEPGKRYEGIRRTAYLPDNERGRKIAKMLGLAFHRKLIFTIGHSRTTGKEGMVTWNDIHHKTSPNIDSQFGYPDPTYFDRVVEELAAKGITEKDI